ncbi:unnamed protein product [Thlaspi arvense]|uniref:Uncharacterized protein n=1 Tax=Thlaspi arvense TaxID=13288 RepID=A0AAU9RZQ9_THLAR|nr:unnamed protein product [Thlaspi arvense]
MIEVDFRCGAPTKDNQQKLALKNQTKGYMEKDNQLMPALKGQTERLHDIHYTGIWRKKIKCTLFLSMSFSLSNRKQRWIPRSLVSSRPSLISVPFPSLYTYALFHPRVPQEWKKRVMVIWSKPKPKVEEEEEDEAIVESDVDLEGDTAEPDNDLPKRTVKLLKKLSEGKFDEAIEHLTQSVIFNPTSAIMYGNRASVSVMLKKPNAAVRDANATLEYLLPLLLPLEVTAYRMVALCAHQRIVHLILEPEKSENENIYISIRDNRKTDAAAEIIFSGKAQPGVTATNVNVDEVEMVVAEGSKGFGKGLSKGTAFLDFLCSASDAFK